MKRTTDTAELPGVAVTAPMPHHGMAACGPAVAVPWCRRSNGFVVPVAVPIAAAVPQKIVALAVSFGVVKLLIHGSVAPGASTDDTVMFSANRTNLKLPVAVNVTVKLSPSARGGVVTR
jgi:hypothetical protein